MATARQDSYPHKFMIRTAINNRDVRSRRIPAGWLTTRVRLFHLSNIKGFQKAHQMAQLMNGQCDNKKCFGLDRSGSMCFIRIKIQVPDDIRDQERPVRRLLPDLKIRAIICDRFW
jgi:hypothetical protein